MATDARRRRKDTRSRSQEWRQKWEWRPVIQSAVEDDDEKCAASPPPRIALHLARLPTKRMSPSLEKILHFPYFLFGVGRRKTQPKGQSPTRWRSYDDDGTHGPRRPCESPYEAPWARYFPKFVQVDWRTVVARPKNFSTLNDHCVSRSLYSKRERPRWRQKMTTKR